METGAEAARGARTRALYEQLLAPVARQVDVRLADEAQSLPAELRGMYDYAVGGGMRFRPCLMYLAYLACSAGAGTGVGADGERDGGPGPGIDTLIQLASAVELLHKASLVHDDLIDGDTLRRGRQSFHAAFGSERAVVMGDLLVAMAHDAVEQMHSVLPTGVYDQIRSRFSKAHLDLCRGELLELVAAPCQRPLSRDYVDRVIEGKTASLMEQSMAIGAVVAGAPEACVDALARYGRCMGFVFQTINDINNLTGFDLEVKGQAMTDLALGRVGYPVLGLAMITGAERTGLSAPGVRRIEGSGDALRALVQEGRLRAWLEEIVCEYADKARHALRVLPECGARDALDAIGREMFESWFWNPESCVDCLGGGCIEESPPAD